MSTIQVKRKVPASAPIREGRPGLGQSQHSRNRLTGFVQDASGDVAILFGLMSMVMFMLIGAAVDIGRWLNARDQTISAVDAAVLAAGRALQTNGGNSNDAIAVAQKYYSESVKSRLVVKNDTVAFSIGDNGTSVQANGNAEINTPFMALAGIRELQLLKVSGADSSKAVLAVGGNAEMNLEIAMMLDTSGSMAETTGTGAQKIVDMKAAASDLVNIIVWADQTSYKSRVALVPFSGDVRIPGGWLGQVTDPLWPSSRLLGGNNGNGNGNNNNPLTFSRTSCVAERTGSHKHTDDAAVAGDYLMNAYTRNGNCSQSSSDNEVVPMTSNKTVLLDKISKLDLGGGTAGHIGTAWAYYMLSPKWAPIMQQDAKPTAYGTPKTKKIAILMTDGEYNFTYDNLGIPTNSSGGNANGNSSAAQALAICNQMKANIDVYTVGFDLNGNQTAINTLKNCASDQSKFYDAADGNQLKAAFRDIALKVSKLYLTK
jgi:Flp pilus assembly protein TadG